MKKIILHAAPKVRMSLVKKVEKDFKGKVVAFFNDERPEEWGFCLKGIPIYNCKDHSRLEYDIIVIMYARESVNLLYKEDLIMKYGIPEEKIIADYERNKIKKYVFCGTEREFESEAPGGKSKDELIEYVAVFNFNPDLRGKSINGVPVYHPKDHAKVDFHLLVFPRILSNDTVKDIIKAYRRYGIPRKKIHLSYSPAREIRGD